MTAQIIPFPNPSPELRGDREFLELCELLAKRVGITNARAAESVRTVLAKMERDKGRDFPNTRT